MGFSRKELVQFLDGLMELVSEENRTEALLVKEKFINDFEKNYGFEKEEETVVTDLPPYYVAAMPDDVQEEIRQKVIAGLTEAGQCTPENIENIWPRQKVNRTLDALSVYKEDTQRNNCCDSCSFDA